MSLSAAEIAILCDKLRPLLVGGQIQKIRQPAAHRFLLDVYTPGQGAVSLLIGLEKAKPIFHGTLLRLKNPDAAPALCLALRKLLQGGRVRDIAPIKNDRVIVIDIDVMEDGVVIGRKLVIELLPIQPSLFVLDPAMTIEAASDAISTEARTIARGSRYTFPAARPAREETKAPFARFGETIPDDLFERLDAEIPDGGSSIDRISLVREIEREVQRQFKRISKVEEDVRANEGGTELERLGELLKSSIHQVKRGMTSIKVVDWEAADPVNAEISVPLDGTLSPQENLDEIFRRAKKKERGFIAAQERLEESKGRLAKLQAILERAKAEDADELESIVAAAAEYGIVVAPSGPKVLPKKKEAPPPRRPYNVFFSIDGIEIRVGRTSDDNDDLTFHHSDGSDWWLHAQNVPGSHVVVRTHDAIPEQTLLDAATLAIAYSKAPFAGKQAVSYTRRKFVTKFKGAAPGKVSLREWKTILLRPEDERLERLKKSRPGEK